MKKVGIILTILTVICFIINISCEIIGSYQYEKKFQSYWNLADKASSIPQKALNVDKFVSALEGWGMQGDYNAIIFQTPDNSFDENLTALKSLQLRLHEIETMDIKSFEYQTAIQQITQQEQGEAGKMLKVFHGIWWKHTYFLLWDWIAIINYILLTILIIVGIILWVDE